ncbi:CUB domain protein [Cooperia oncophora]
MRFAIVALILLQKSHASRKSALPKSAVNSGRFDFTGCPLDNDFYYGGVISSPYYPNLYPPNTECYYYITAEPGKILSFNFTHFDLESCCDYVTIYDGEGMRSPVLVQ